MQAATATCASGYLAARGVTTLGRSTNWVQVANLTGQRLLIRAGKHVANFHRQDKDCYLVVDWDLDVEDRAGREEATGARSVGPAAALASACSAASADVCDEADVSAAFKDSDSPGAP